MKLDYILYSKGYKNTNKLKHLFEHAFPPAERPPFSWMPSLEKNKLFSVEDNGEFIGLISVIEYQDLVYIFFLAVKKCFRGKGYGSRILKDALSKYHDKRVFLLAEDPDIPCDNKEERNNRIKFYSHNGLNKTDLKVCEYGVEYVSLTSGGYVSKEEFLSVMKYLLGDYYSIYQTNVN